MKIKKRPNFNKNISKYKPENKVCKKTVIVSKFLFTWNFQFQDKHFFNADLL